MGGKKKKGDHDKTVKIIVMVTAILNLVKSLIELIGKLTE